MAIPKQVEQLPERRAEVEALYGKLETWAAGQPAIRAVGIAGSWARGKAKESSDVDVILLAAQPEPYTESDQWLDELLSSPVIRRAQFGVVSERRVRLSSGLEVEFGIGPVSWASATPVDIGTRQVVSDGLVIVYDPDALLAQLQDAISADLGSSAIHGAA